MLKNNHDNNQASNFLLKAFYLIWLLESIGGIFTLCNILLVMLAFNFFFPRSIFGNSGNSSLSVPPLEGSQSEHIGWFFFCNNTFVTRFLINLFIYFFICSEFCHTLKWNSHGFTCVPHPDPPSHLPLHLFPLGLPSAPGPSACLMHPAWAGDLFHPR